MIKCVVASRKSPMALAQTALVCEKLQVIVPTLQFTILPMVSEGDKQLATSLAKIGGKGLFVKELEEALLRGQADFAVHSAKDLPYRQPPGLTLAAFVERDNPCDVLVSSNQRSLDALPQGAVIGTSSLRRQALLTRQRPDIVVRPLRGNVNTRLSRLDAGEFDALVLAAAGLTRLGLTDRMTEILPVSNFIPAIGQGALAIQCRSDDLVMKEIISRLNHVDTEKALIAERTVSAALKADCHWPLAAYAFVEDQQLKMHAMCADAKAETMIHASGAMGLSGDPSALGQAVAKQLIDQGALRLLAGLRSS